MGLGGSGEHPPFSGCSKICASLLERRAREDGKEETDSLVELIVHASLLQDRRRWPFQHFKALLPVGVDEADEGAALVPLKARSRDADMIPQLNIA